MRKVLFLISMTTLYSSHASAKLGNASEGYDRLRVTLSYYLSGKLTADAATIRNEMRKLGLSTSLRNSKGQEVSLENARQFQLADEGSTKWNIYRYDGPTEHILVNRITLPIGGSVAPAIDQLKVADPNGVYYAVGRDVAK